MKNIYYLLLTLAISSLSFGQELMLNGDFESWDDSTTPTSYSKAESVLQETVEFRGGASSAKHSGGRSDIAQTVTGIIPGETYTISLWYKFEVAGNARLWSTWKAGTTNLSDNADVLQPSTYLDDTGTTWAEYTHTLVAPATADSFNFEVRTYGSTVVYWDDFSVFKEASDPCDGVTGAPAIADDFEGNSVDILEYVGDNNVTYSVIDGTPTGVTSNVLEYVDGGGAGSDYANLQLRTCNKFDMAVTNFFTMDVYIVGSSLTGLAPNQVAFKLQDQSMGANAWQSQVEVVVPVTAVDTWQTVEFDFIGSSDRIDFDQVVIQFNGEANQDTVTAYIDNLVSSTSPEPDPCDGVTGAPAIADDFDGNSVDILEYVGDNDATFATVDGTPFGSTSNVLQYVDNGGQYANIQLKTCNKFDMAVTNFFTMDVYIDGSSLTGAQTNKVQFKLQDQSMGGNAWQSQVVSEVLIDAVDTWQTVEFDFIAASGRTDIDQVVIQFNGEDNNDQVIAYIDNLVSSTSPEPDPCDGVTGAPAIADDFDGNSVDILEYVGDNDATFATVDGTPFGSTSNVLQYVDNGGQYANIQLRTCNKFDMAVTNFFTMDVYIDGSSLTGAQTNKVQFKLQDQSMGGNAWQSQVVSEVLIDAVDTWQTVEFDFIAASGRTDIDQVVIQFNGEDNNDQVIAYIDNLVSSTSVADTTPPVIVLEGANPQELTVGDAYVELGATATDDTDDNTTLTAAIVIDATAVDTATAGSYSVTYNVSDAAGNAATEVVRTVTVEEATVSGPSCDHTFVMIDSYGDGWNGASVDILVNGVAVVEGAAAADADVTSGSTENLIFQASTGDNITLSNWQTGGFNSEISWAILDNDGTQLDSGSYSAAGSAVGYCVPPPTCDHTFVMIDSYGDGWNGASVDILVNGVAVVEGAAAADADVTSGSSEDLLFQAEEGSTITLSNWQTGSFNSEISWAILDGNGTELDFGSYGELSEVTAYCTPPSCLDPTDLAISDITTTTASVTWTANNGETTWEYQVVESGVAPNATGDATSDNPLSLTGLTAYTAYDVYVRANCGDSVSGWVMESFTTLFQAPSCGETAEYCYANGDGGGSGFEGSYTVDPLELVFTSTVDTTGDYLTLTIGGETESNYDWVYVTDGAGNVILEPVSGAMEYDVVSEDGTVNVYISADGSASCASPSSWSGEPDTPLSFTVSCNPPPSCIDPTDLTVSNITTTTASVSWTANSGESAWEYQVVESGVAPNATGDATSDNPLELTLLTANTTYDVYVRANCDADGTSEWVTVSFTTPCVSYSIPYFEGFESGYTHASSVGGCLSQESITGTGTWAANNTLTSFNRTPRTGDWNAYVGYSNEDWLFISVDLTADMSYTASVHARQDGSTASNSDITISYGASASAAAMTNTIVPATGIVNGDYQLISGAFTPTTSGTHVIGIKGYMNGSPYYISIDDISIDLSPDCLMPTDLAVSDITTTTASVSWTANSGESAWEYQVVESGVAPNATGDATSDNPLELTLLTSNTTYDVYVRANCGTDGTSEWGMVSFTTLPDPIVPNYTNDFATFPGDLWSQAEGAIADGPSGSTSLWDTGNFAHGTNAPAAYINIYSTTRDEWLISPSFDLSGVNYYLNVDVAATEYLSSFSTADPVDAIWGVDDFVTLMVSEDSGSTWTELYRWDANNNPGVAGAAMPEIDLSAYTGLAKFAFYAESTASNEDIDFFVDNFSITSTSLGLEDVNTTSNFTYFPNPVNNVLSIKAQASIDSITVYNMLGQTVVRSTPNTTTTAVDMSGLQTGAYFVQVAINNSIETVRVIKN